MLFVTNRTPRQSVHSRKNRKIGFDIQNNSVGQSLYFCERLGPDNYIEIGSQAFFNQLKALDGVKQVLLYVHGFNNVAERDIFPRATLLQRLIVEHGANNLIHVIPIMWPCDDDAAPAMLDDYWDDQRAADQSSFAFARMLGKFNDWRYADAQKRRPCTKRINILAHSMGARVLCGALNHWARRYGSGGIPQIFRNIFLVAADLVNHTFEPNEEGQIIAHSARNVVVYYANDDLAMSASKVANLKSGTMSRRLGMTGPENLAVIPRNVYEVDCDNFNNALDSPLGHSYFLDGANEQISPVLAHLIQAIRTGRVQPPVRSVQL